MSKAVINYVEARKALIACRQANFKQLCQRCSQWKTDCKTYGLYVQAWMDLQSSVRRERLFTAFTDGSCSVNPGPMGASAVIVETDSYGQATMGKVVADFFGEGTNNRAELHGILLALQTVKSTVRLDSRITIYSDSAWAVNCLTGVNKKIKKNLDLLKTITDTANHYRGVFYQHVKAHEGHHGNEIADHYAVTARTEQSRLSAKLNDEQLRLITL